MPQLICGEGLWYFMWSVWPSMMVEVDAEMGLIESGERVGSESSLQGRDTNRPSDTPHIDGEHRYRKTVQSNTRLHTSQLPSPSPRARARPYDLRGFPSPKLTHVIHTGVPRHLPVHPFLSGGMTTLICSNHGMQIREECRQAGAPVKLPA